MLKDKHKPAAPARARGPRGRKRRPGEAEEPAEAAAPELQASGLETCRGHLRSILTHWGPVFPSADPAPDPGDRTSPQSHATGPAHAIASLVVSWVLRAAAEHPLSGAEVAGLFRWLQSCVVPQPPLVADLLADSAVKSSVFKLYSRFWGAEGPGGPKQSAACQPNAVMLRLIEALSPAGTPLPPAVETLRLSSLDDKEEATRGDLLAGLTGGSGGGPRHSCGDGGRPPPGPEGEGRGPCLCWGEAFSAGRLRWRRTRAWCPAGDRPSLQTSGSPKCPLFTLHTRQRHPACAQCSAGARPGRGCRQV